MPFLQKDVTPLDKSIVGRFWTCQNCVLPLEWKNQILAFLTMRKASLHLRGEETPELWLHHLDPSSFEAWISSRSVRYVFEWLVTCHAQFATGRGRQCHLGCGPCTTSASRREWGLCLELISAYGGGRLEHCHWLCWLFNLRGRHWPVTSGVFAKQQTMNMMLPCNYKWASWCFIRRNLQTALASTTIPFAEVMHLEPPLAAVWRGFGGVDFFSGCGPDTFWVWWVRSLKLREWGWVWMRMWTMIMDDK